MDVIKEYQKYINKRGDTLTRLIGLAQIHLVEELRHQLILKEDLDLSFSQIHCLQFLCLKGINQSELASRLCVTKQAMNQAISGLEKKGLVFKEVDPIDSRSKVILHTEKGKRIVSSIIKVTTKIENSLIEKIGERNFKNLKESLENIQQMSEKNRRAK